MNVTTGKNEACECRGPRAASYESGANSSEGRTRFLPRLRGVIFGLALLATPSLFAAEGAVYVMTNESAANSVVIFDRAADGRLTQVGSVPTGGRGSGGEIDPLASQGALTLSADGSWLAAVNARSKDVTVFRVLENGLEIADMAKTGGSFPVSVDLHGDRVAVLNAGGQGSVVTFGFDSDEGQLGKRRRRLLRGADLPTQVSFTPDGESLVVTDRGRSVIWRFELNGKGRPNPAVETISAGAGPFGFDFGRNQFLVVSELGEDASNGTGSASSYALEPEGTFTTLTAASPNRQSATCWAVAAGAKNRYVYTTNTSSGTLSRYLVKKDGALRRNPANGVAFRFSGEPRALPIDAAATADGGFLYTLNTGRGKVGAFRVKKSSGGLVFLGEIGDLAARGALQGIAAR